MADATPRTLQPPMISDIHCRESNVGVVGALLGVRKFLPPHPSSSLVHSCRYFDHAGVDQLAALGHLSIFGDTNYNQNNTLGLQNMMRGIATLLVHKRFTNCNSSFL